MKRYLGSMLAGMVALGATLGLRIDDPALTREARVAVFDTYQNLRPRPYQPAPVRVVDLDEQTLARVGQWPWSRVEVADLIARLDQLGAAVVVFDVLFAEPDRTSPGRVAAEWLVSGDDASYLEQLHERLAALPDNDQVLAEQIARQTVVTGFMFNHDSEPRGTPPLRKAGVASAGSPPLEVVPKFSAYVNNLSMFEAGARGNGSIAIEPDSDGVVRRVPLLQAYDGQVYPTLAVEALRVALGASTVVTRAADASGEVAVGDRHGLNAVKVGSMELPTTADGQLWLHYTRTVPERTLPAWEVMADAPDIARLQSLLDGHIVLIGSSAAGLMDLRATPLLPAEAGVRVQAQVLEQMLLGHFLQRPDWADGAELLFILLLGGGLLLAMPRLGATWCAVIALAAIAAAIGASWYAYSQHRLLFDPLYPSLAAVLVYLATSLMNFVRTERERSHIRSAFSHYLSPHLVRRLAGDPDRLTLGGETRELTVMFCDVRGFTAISEAFKERPQALVQLINDLLTPLSDEILNNRGTIDKYMGDCVMAFWNAPLDDPEHAEDACTAALAMFDAVVRVNAENGQRAAAGGTVIPPLAVGIGLNTGDMVVGNLGSKQRFDYSVLGDAANLASRLEGQSKSYGVDVVLGEATARRVETGFALLELDLVAVKGKREAARIFTLLGDREVLESAAFATWRGYHDAMLVAYRFQDWGQAERELELAFAAGGSERMPKFYALYRARIAEFREAPPPADWDAIYRATTK